MGRKSREIGKREERAFRTAMIALSGWPHWRRTQRGDKQFTDLEPCDKSKAVRVYPEGLIWVVECKYRERLNVNDIPKWWKELADKKEPEEMHQHTLLIRQKWGPTIALRSYCGGERRMCLVSPRGIIV